MKIEILKLSIAAVLSAQVVVAADDAWVGDPASANWLDKLNWTSGDWTEGNNAVFGSSSVTAVNVNGPVSAAKVTVNGDYTFSGEGPLAVSGGFVVSKNTTATVDGVPVSVGGIPVNGGMGTLELKGGTSTFNRLVTTGAGTVRFNGGAHSITGTSTSASASVVALHFNDGHVVIDGGAHVTVAKSNSYSDNSGAVVEVDDGVLDMWNVGEFLHGFSDFYGSSTSHVSRLVIRNKGEVVAKAFRLGKVVRSTFERYGQDYARTVLETGGVFRVKNFSMDSAGTRHDYCSRVDFNGGTLIVTNINNSRFDVSTVGGNWSNCVFKVFEGGFRYQQPRSDCYANFYTPLQSGAEHDGGVTISGQGFLYFGNPSWPSAYNGGVHLVGTSGITLIPTGADRAFGAVPVVPTTNVFFEGSGPFLHFGDNWTLHPNRTVKISAGVKAKIGVVNNRVGRIGGVITGEGRNGSLGRLHVVNNWPGCLEIGPMDGRTNTIGMIQVDGFLRHVAGTTLVTSNNPSKTYSEAPLYIRGNNSSFVGTRGVLEIAGGTFKVTQTVWGETAEYGQLIVTNGHADLTSMQEFHNGLGSPGRTIVSGKGMLSCSQLRISQTTEVKGAEPVAQIHLLTGGTLKLNNFWNDYSSNSKYTGVVLLDGGTLMARKDAVNFLGETSKGNFWHTYVFVRAGANGAIVDTDGHAITIQNPILSGAVSDGGITKKGAGTLTLASTNTYNGVTRVEKGTLAFTHVNGFPGGHLEIPASALAAKDRTTPFVTMKTVNFRAGSKIRIVDVTDEAVETMQGIKTVATFTEACAALPELVVVDSHGNETPASPWVARLTDGGTTLKIGYVRGTVFVLR